MRGFESEDYHFERDERPLKISQPEVELLRQRELTESWQKVAQVWQEIAEREHARVIELEGMIREEIIGVRFSHDEEEDDDADWVKAAHAMMDNDEGWMGAITNEPLDNP